MARTRSRAAGEQGEQKPLVVLPYVQGVTERIAHTLKPHARVISKSGQSLRNMLVRPKEKRDKLLNTGIVYQYECECYKVYVGETCRSIRAREAEDKRAIRNMDNNHSGISKQSCTIRSTW